MSPAPLLVLAAVVALVLAQKRRPLTYTEAQRLAAERHRQARADSAAARNLR